MLFIYLTRKQINIAKIKAKGEKLYIDISFVPLIFCSCYIKKVIEYFIVVTRRNIITYD